VKVMIAFPTLPESKGYPLLTQNRQFQWFKVPSAFIYPIIPATAATMLKQNDFDVNFYDGIAQRHTYEQFEKEFEKFSPDIIAFETKTPVVKQHWSIINKLKASSPDTKFVLMGDHVSALPKESMEKSQADYAITGGDFDFTLLELAKHLRDNTRTVPTGIWFRQGSYIKSTGKYTTEKNLDEAPFIDRELTNWKLYGEAYLMRPLTYIMSGRDCPMKCSFCSWTWNLFPNMRYRSVNNVLDEIELLADKYKIKEIFDDTGTFTIDKRWVEQFCKEMVERGLDEKIFFSINARFDNLMDAELCKKMKRANFRLLKVGLESANNDTLKRINKNITVEKIAAGYKAAKDNGLTIMLTIMVGYPWETKEQAQKTINLAKKLLKYKTKIGDVLQASIVTPYPGTPMYEEAVKNDWLRVGKEDWEKFDMKEPVLKSPMQPEDVVSMCDSVWRIYLDPTYVRKSVTSIRSWREFMLLMKGVSPVLGHIKDFK